MCPPHPQKTPCRCIDPGTCAGMAGCGEDLPHAAKAPAVPRWQCDIPQPEGLPCAPIFPVNICSTVPEMCSVKFASESSASILVIVFARTSLSPASCSPGLQKGCVSYSGHEELEPNCTPAAPHTSFLSSIFLGYPSARPQAGPAEVNVALSLLSHRGCLFAPCG